MPNVFLIGRPGCGKSVVFQILKGELQARGYRGELKRIDDFPILKHIFDTDTRYKRHRPAPGGGVKVTDDAVWDDLAKGLNDQALKLQSPDRLLFIEFSRDNYVRAFKNFSPEILKNSLIVYIDAPFDVCWERNVCRAREEQGLDAHLVSREEMEKTYARDDHEELPKHVAVPVLIVKNESDDMGNLRGELKKVVEKLTKIVSKPFKKGR
ncbi:MAG: deoxynucleoside kinase [Candidatus Hodarchaeaceae archaeon]|nr:deoxynucleoside kinase [Candidatus Hodarchaeaceae archaeon]